MTRRTIIIIAGLGVLLVVLAVALASIGTQYDRTRIDRDELQFERDGLEDQVNSMSKDADHLKTLSDEQRKTIEQLKAELERTRRSTVQSPAPALSSAPQPAATP